MVRSTLQIINFFMKLVTERSENNAALPRVFCHNTYFFKKLTEESYDKVKRWTRKVLYRFSIQPRVFLLGSITRRNNILVRCMAVIVIHVSHVCLCPLPTPRRLISLRSIF